MTELKFDVTKTGKKFKILNATNGGPFHKRHAADQYRSNFEDYKAVGFPYSRNHDSGDYDIYGGPFSHDITHIFPNFDADVNDPASYDFACTDESILCTLEAGTQTFYRLGQTIEHQIKKHGTLPPKDFKKWAQICEHIIRHYNEGWADGFHLNIEYWEIWNEPNLDPDDSDNKRCWGGTKAQFFDLYEITAKHLKSCFPHLKIGGPAFAGPDPDEDDPRKDQWADDFLREMHERGVEIDFFSWHLYSNKPERIIINLGERMKELLVKHGYDKAESICNEWNYIKGWTDEYVYSIEMMHGLKNASFIAAVMSLAQKSSTDMLMYYDTMPSVFNGLFDLYTYRKLKGYYPMLWYSKFYGMEAEVCAAPEVDGIYTLCGVDKDGKVLCMATHYDDDDNAPAKDVRFDFGKDSEFEIYLVDNAHDGELVNVTKDLSFTFTNHSVMLIKEK